MFLKSVGWEKREEERVTGSEGLITKAKENQS